jgi:hypothetical protein
MYASFSRATDRLPFSSLVSAALTLANTVG